MTKTYSTNEVLAAFGGATTPAAHPANTGTINTGSTPPNAASASISAPIAGTPPKLASVRLSNMNKVARSGLVNDGGLHAAAAHMPVWPDYDSWRDDWLFTIAEAIVAAPDKEQELRELFRETNKVKADFTADKQQRYGTLDAYLDTADKLLDDTIPRTRAKLAAGKRTGAKDELIGHDRIFQVACANGWDGYTAAARVYQALVANSNTAGGSHYGSSARAGGNQATGSSPLQSSNRLSTGGNRLVPKNISYDPKKLKRISWLLAGILLRGRCSLITGLAGSSKTTLAMHIATALAAGFKTIGPFKVYRPRQDGFRVLYISAEEDENDLNLLSSATASVMNLTPAERQRAQTNLTIHDACDSGWALGRQRPDKREDFAPEDADIGLAELKTVLDAYQFDLVVIDTAASLFKIRSELDNNALTEVVRRLDRVMKQYDCACLILHHTPKVTREQAAGLRGELALSRGGGGLPFATRAAYNITAPGGDEAAQFITAGIDPTVIRRLDAARVTSFKEPPAALMEIMSVQVITDDGTAESVRAIRFNAQVGAVMDSGGITDILRNIVMAAIDKGTTDEHGAQVPLSPSGNGARNKRAPITAIARAIMDMFPELNEAQAKKRATDVLKELQGLGYVVVNPNARTPKYKPDGSPSGTNVGKALECRWELVPWRKPDSASESGVETDASSTGGSN